MACFKKPALRDCTAMRNKRWQGPPKQNGPTRARTLRANWGAESARVERKHGARLALPCSRPELGGPKLGGPKGGPTLGGPEIAGPKLGGPQLAGPK